MKIDLEKLLSILFFFVVIASICLLYKDCSEQRDAVAECIKLGRAPLECKQAFRSGGQ